MKSRDSMVPSAIQRSAPVTRMIGWAAGCLLRCAADLTAQILQDAAARRSAGHSPTASPQGKS